MIYLFIHLSVNSLLFFPELKIFHIYIVTFRKKIYILSNNFGENFITDLQNAECCNVFLITKRQQSECFL